VRRTQAYIAAVAGVLSGADRECRLDTWRDLEAQYMAAYQAAHPAAPAAAARAAFADLARSILAAADRLREREAA